MTILAPWFLSLHALERMDEMGVTRAQVLEVLEWPEVTCRSFPAPRRAAYRGQLRVVYNAQDRVVVTVLWKDQLVTCR